MKIYRTKENNFRVRVEKNEHVSIKPGPGASVATSGRRGGHIVSGCFSAVSMKTTLPAPEFYDDFAEYDIDIFCHSENSYNGASSDIENRVHINFSGHEYILEARRSLEFYVETMSFERALEMCKIIDSKKIHSDEKLCCEDLRQHRTTPIRAGGKWKNDSEAWRMSWKRGRGQSKSSRQAGPVSQDQICQANTKFSLAVCFCSPRNRVFL